MNKLNPIYWLDRFEKLEGGVITTAILSIACSGLFVGCFIVAVYKI